MHLTPRRLVQPRDSLRSHSWRGSLSPRPGPSPRPVSVGLLFPVTVHRSLLFGSGGPASEGRSVRRASRHLSLWLPPRFISATDHALSFCTVGNHMGEAIQGPTQSVAQSCGQGVLATWKDPEAQTQSSLCLRTLGEAG